MTAVNSSIAELATADWQHLQSVVAEFERNLRTSTPVIDEVLAANPALREVLLVELVHAEPEHRLRSGAAVRLEEYVDRFPDLTGPHLPELVLADFRIRRDLDPLFEGGDYSTRFPEHATTIQLLFEREIGASTLAFAALPPASGLPAVPGYEVRRLLGRGGMGVVYEAWDGRLKRTIALKMLRHEESQAAIDRLRREAAALAAFQHPGIVQIFDVGEAAGRTYLALEYISGGSLGEALAKAPIDAPAAAKLVAGLAIALQAAHDRGIIHRDIKPGNILLTTGGVGKLNDFGLAKQMDDTTSPTETGALLGTPGYMAPEQTLGEVTPAVDVYALGTVLYECLTGRPPFRGATPLDTLALTRDREPVPLRQLQPSVPRDLETICLKCLRKSPADRYASAADLAADLERFQSGRAILARPVGTVEHATKWMRRNPVPTLLAGLLLVAAAGILTQWTRYTSALRVERDAAEAARKDAEASDREARQRAVEAEAQTALARTERSRAEASYLAARGTLDEFRKLRDDDRIAEGELEPFRKEMLRAEAEFYRQFTKIQGESLTFRSERAEAWLNLAAILNTLGDLPGERDAINQAMTQYAALSREHPDRDDFAHHAIHSREVHAKHLALAGSLAESERELESLVPMAQAAAMRWPEKPNFRLRQAIQLQRLGELAWSRRDGPAAINHYQKVLTLLEPLLKAHPDNAGYLCSWLQSSMLLGVVQFNTRDPRAAIASFQQALTPFEAAPAVARGDATAANLAAQIQCEHGFVLWNQREDAAAEELMQSAWKSLTALHDKYPHRNTLLLPLVRVTLRYAKVIQSRGRVTEAMAKLDACLPLARTMLAAAPGDPFTAEVFATAVRQTADQSLPLPPTPERQAALDKDRDTIAKLQERFPKNPKLANHLGHLLGHKADQHRRAGEYEAMVPVIERAVALDPSPSTRYLRVIAWAKTGRVREAAAEAKSLEQGPPPFDPFQLAMLYSILAAEARKLPGVSDTKQSEMANDFLDRGVKSLHAAERKKGLQSPARLRNLKEATDFAALRERPEVKNLMEKLQR